MSTDETEDPLPSGEEAERWQARAEDDLTVARLVLASPVAVRWAACFHAQQASEKAIKALLVLRGIDFPRSHALDVLADLAGQPDQQSLDRQALLDLNPWAVAGRYPEDLPEPSDQEAHRLVKAASAVVGQVAALIDASSNMESK